MRSILSVVIVIGAAVAIMVAVDSQEDTVASPPVAVAPELPRRPAGKPPAVDRNLSRTLARLDALIKREHPELYSRFRPGLSRAEISRLEKRLAPYRLPKELVTVYRWHDGWDDGEGTGEFRGMFIDDRFNSLAQAIEERRFQIGLGAAPEWNPLWFPAFGSEYGELVALRSSAGLPGGQVYSFGDPEGLGTKFDSVPAYFATVLEAWRRGLMEGIDTGRYPKSQWFAIYGVMVRHNPRSLDERGL